MFGKESLSSCRRSCSECHLVFFLHFIRCRFSIFQTPFLFFSRHQSRHHFNLHVCLFLADSRCFFLHSNTSCLLGCKSPLLPPCWLCLLLLLACLNVSLVLHLQNSSRSPPSSQPSPQLDVSLDVWLFFIFISPSHLPESEENSI